MDIGQRLKNLRIMKGLTIREVAEAVQTPATTYREWENGRKILGEPYLKLAELFQVSVSELISGKTAQNAEILRKMAQLDQAFTEFKAVLYRSL